MNKPITYYRKWKWLAPLGLMLIGFGFSLSGQAILLKGGEGPWWEWVALGTVGLVVFNAGVSVFGDAVKRRLWDEILQREAQQSQPPQSSS
jgi:hypothetical protein